MNDPAPVLEALGLDAAPAAVHVGTHPAEAGAGGEHVVRSPIDGRELARLTEATAAQTEAVIERARSAFDAFRVVPAPRRGELVRRLGVALREQQDALAALVTWEVGKIPGEARGEVQEMIDMCDFAVGLSRQLYGKTMPSERAAHRLMEQWHPLGPIGVITAFNFPVAVWAWNAALALVAGDPVVWKPSEKAPLTALACHRIAAGVLETMPDLPPDVLSVVIGPGDAVGRTLAGSRQLPLISATGSVRMGRSVAQAVAARLGRSLLELGGNNALVVAPSADLELAARAIVFSAVGTAGQRCTTLRRLIVHRTLLGPLVDRLRAAYDRLPIGDPRQDGVLVGPLIDETALQAMDRALDLVRQGGGTVHGGGRLSAGVPAGGVYVRPALAEVDANLPIVQEETFAPVLYVMPYDTLEDAIALHNGVPQGLSSAIFTSDLREAERFCSAAGSDCGIVNVNVGTSGAEIGGAFGGEKDTGGGRESGSDAWKAYMRRVTTTVNHSSDLPLAQGIPFAIRARRG
jgi:aldehyde dehydrogenase (NAD+)